MNKYIISVLSIFLLFSLILVPVVSGEILSQFTSDTTYYTVGYYDYYATVQTIFWDSNASISSIEFELFKTGSPDGYIGCNVFMSGSTFLSGGSLCYVNEATNYVLKSYIFKSCADLTTDTNGEVVCFNFTVDDSNNFDGDYGLSFCLFYENCTNISTSNNVKFRYDTNTNNVDSWFAMNVQRYGGSWYNRRIYYVLNGDSITESGTGGYTQSDLESYFLIGAMLVGFGSLFLVIYYNKKKK